MIRANYFDDLTKAFTPLENPLCVLLNYSHIIDMNINKLDFIHCPIFIRKNFLMHLSIWNNMSKGRMMVYLQDSVIWLNM